MPGRVRPFRSCPASNPSRRFNDPCRSTSTWNRCLNWRRTVTNCARATVTIPGRAAANSSARRRSSPGRAAKRRAAVTDFPVGVAEMSIEARQIGVAGLRTAESGSQNPGAAARHPARGGDPNPGFADFARSNPGMSPADQRRQARKDARRWRSTPVGRLNPSFVGFEQMNPADQPGRGMKKTAGGPWRYP